MRDFYKYYQSLEDNNIILLFKGSITPDVVTSLLQVTEEKLEKMKEKPKIKKKVFKVLVECLQNMYFHDDKKENINNNNAMSNASLLVIGKENSSYFIIMGNHVFNEKIDVLRSHLEKLNTLTIEQLKSLYFQTLTDGKISKKGGAGLGLIDIYLKSEKNIAYQFENIDKKYSFFSLKVNITN